MKTQLSPAVSAVLAVAAIALVLVGGFFLYNRTNTDERPSKDEEVARFEAAKKYYQGIGVGQKNGTAASGPGGGPPVSPEWEARQKMQQQGGN